jgi:catechol 2,3-dioxygenase-like lactoylglutathione lyase family enzyme
VRLYFVELRVSDWAESLAWYRDVLGLKVLMSVESDSFALLDAGGGRIALKAGEPGSGVLLAFVVDNLDEWVAKLGERIQGPITTSAEGYRRARLLDPDGHEIILFEWTLGERP